MNNKHSALPILAIIIANIIFGLSFMFSSVALKIVDIFTLLSFRFILAFVVLSVLILCKVIVVHYKGKDLKSLFLLGVTQPILYFIFETYGIKNASSSIAGVVISLIPITVALSSAFFLKERPTVLQWVFIIISVIGVVMIVLFGQNGSGAVNTVGIVCLLFAVLSATSFSLLSRKLSTQFSPFELTYFMMGMGAFTFTGICVVQQIIKGNWEAFFAPLGNSQFIVSLLYLGIISSIVAFSCINYAFSKREASRTAIFANLTTIVSVIAGVLFLKEDFKFFQIIGSVLILVGVWGTNTAGSKLPAVSEIPNEREGLQTVITNDI